jgi:AraC-like DNA-binding protein
MSISKKDNLYQLIKSLTKSEKKYFRDFQKKSPTSKLYLLLFDKIDKQSRHLTSEIKTTFDNKANQLPVIKSYLAKLILKILNFYHRDASNFDRIQNNFLEIHHLLERELFDAAEAKIKKIIKLTQNIESPLDLFKALELQKTLLIKRFGATSETIKKELNHIIEEQNYLLKQLSNIQDLQLIQANFYDHFQQGTGLNPTIYTDLDKKPLIVEDKKALSHTAKALQADLKYRVHIFKDKDYQKAQQAIQNIIRQMELNPIIIQDQPGQYLNLLNHKLQLLIFLKKIPDIQAHLAKIRRAPKQYNFDIKKPYLRRYVMEAYALELEIYRNTEQRDKANQLISNIDIACKDLFSPLLRQWRTVMNYEIAKFYFETTQLDKANERLQTIKTAEHSQREEEVLLQSLFLRAQIALIKKNNLELNKTLTDLKNFFKTQKKASRLEKHLQKLFQDWITQAPYPRKHSKLKVQIEKTQKAAEAIPQPELNDLIEWITTLPEKL